ncbi:RNA-dependent RNA polymerase 2 [Rhodamnia argentea]|uniref:RNA-dependent RNA polymerase n=1 Tax=Rhodamnia argentea TaxID=178133 RepID=A0A8B8NHE6_9MYRT|nr:RNA-dependent RNA polymerase 2 [Rhodamnia argentea]
MGGPVAERPTLRVTNIPQTVTAHDLLRFLESALGPGSVYAIDIVTDRKNWKPRGFGRVQFASLHHRDLALSKPLVLKSQTLALSDAYDDIVPRPVHERHRVDGGILHAGFMAERGCLCELERWRRVRVWLMPERRRVEFWVWVEEECYKLEVGFDDVVESVECRSSGDGGGSAGKAINALLLTVKNGPRIYKRISGSDVNSKFSPDRYHIYKEDFNFLWVRTTDFSPVKAVGQSTTFCWEVDEVLQLPAADVFASFPYYKEGTIDLTIEEGGDFHSASEIVPLLECNSGPKLDYAIVFQLNALVHTQKISLAAAYELTDILSTLDVDTAVLVLQKLHKLTSTCYDPVPFVKTQLHVLKRDSKNLPSSALRRLTDSNVMFCHRAFVTPTRIYCLGPELETSNYVVKNFASHSSDFLRVSFVEEDWSKIPPNALSTSTQQGVFSKPLRTGIYHRILTVLREGIVIGEKKFQFLAFSASQLRSNSVWMFSSNDEVTAEQIREWMGCFNKIRSVSKCAARMGQMFSSSVQTMVVPAQDVEIIPDIEVNTRGFDYCFSDGIGKISKSFARQVAQKCGLTDSPSAFQIRYGGYKGVIAVDRRSFRKLSLRESMHKFESSNRMLNVTKWSDSMPCYLNREIISLLSTLGVEDEKLAAMQQKQLLILGRMLTDREAALTALESLSGAERRNIILKMLVAGYEPTADPYLLMMLRAHHEIQLSELKSRCRIHVPKGRILLGCLDEAGILDYGQVYVRVTMTKAELESGEQRFLRKVDETTAAVIGKVVVTKNPCLHPGDIRVLEAVFEVELEETGLVDCIVFPQKGERPHPNECSGGDLDGDLFFISWDEDIIPMRTDTPMDYTGRRPRITDHEVTLEEIHKFFVDYMINDTLGAISTAHLVHADREPEKARSEKCLQLATLHSMAVDFAKTGAPAEMPRVLKPREFPDFMERVDKPMYTSTGVLGKLYRATQEFSLEKSNIIWSEEVAREYYDRDLEVDGYEAFVDTAVTHRDKYIEKLSALMHFYGAESEDEILTGNLRSRAVYLRRDNRKYGDMKDRISLSVKSLHKEAREWFESGCKANERERLASAWYRVAYHPSFIRRSFNFLSFPWIVGDVLLSIRSVNRRKSLA